MQFNLSKSYRYWWPVTVRSPDPENPGKVIEQKLRVQFEPLPRDEEIAWQEKTAKLKTARARVEDEKVQMRSVVKNWDGVLSGSDIVPFSPEALDLALQHPWFRIGLANAFAESLSGEEARMGN